MVTIIAGLLLPALAGVAGVTRPGGPHDAGTNACNWSPLPSYCLTLVPNWFDQWAWLLPTSLVCAAAILFLWAPLQGLIRIAAHFRRPIPLNEAAALIYGELRGTDL